jgi:hypothetical protein
MMWMVIRTSDGVVLARFSSKAKAMAAALRFGKDGRREYRVVSEASPLPAIPPRSSGLSVPPRGH